MYIKVYLLMFDSVVFGIGISPLKLSTVLVVLELHICTCMYVVRHADVSRNF